MKLLSLVVLLFGLASVPSSSSGSVAEDRCDRCRAMSLSRVLGEFRDRTERGELPSCPQVTECPHGRTHVQGPSTFTDTGLVTCRVPQRTAPLRCPTGTTLHLEARQGEDCRCNGEPAPGGGEEVELVVGFACQRYDL